MHVGSHLGDGLEAGLDRIQAGARRRCSPSCPTTSGSCSRTRPAPAARSGRTVDELVGGDRALPAPATRRLPRLVPPLRVGHRHRRARGDDARSSTTLDAHVGARPAAGAAPERLADAVRLEPRPARERRRGADRRGDRELPRPPAAAGPAVRRSRRPATTGKGVDAQCMASANRLHEAGLALYEA